MTECPVHCLDNPCNVDMINWRCVECKTDLKEACAEYVEKKATAARERAELAAVPEEGELSQAQIDDRRQMALEV